VFVTGILRVGISHTVPGPANTIPVTCMGTYCTVICVVSDETRGITFTHGILIIKITIIIILFQYFTNNKRGGYREMAATHTR